MTIAETMKLTASSQSAVVDPRVATRTPPSGAPTSTEPRAMAPWRPVARSIRTSPSSATSGRSASRAVTPGASSSAPTNTSAITCQTSIPERASTSGMAATASALATSAATLVRRNPSRSTSAPPKNAEMTTGRNEKNAVNPVSAALPVSSSTSHGIAIRAIVLPVFETASAASSATIGVRRLTPPPGGP